MSWFQGITNNMSIQAHVGGQYGQINSTYGTTVTTNDVSSFYCAGTGLSVGNSSVGSATCYDRNGPSSTCVDVGVSPFNASVCTNNDMSKTVCFGVGLGGGLAKISANAGSDICYDVRPK